MKETQNALKHTHTHTNAERVSARGERARDAQLFSFLFSFSLSERGRFDEKKRFKLKTESALARTFLPA